MARKQKFSKFSLSNQGRVSRNNFLREAELLYAKNKTKKDKFNQNVEHMFNTIRPNLISLSKDEVFNFKNLGISLAKQRGRLSNTQMNYLKFLYNKSLKLPSSST